MSRLRIIDNLRIVKEIDGVAMQASLICDCGNEYFHVLHTGKQTQGIFRPLLVKSNKQIFVMCKCKNCGKELIVCDSTIDGLTPLKVEKPNYTEFTTKRKNVFKIILYYNYQKEDYMTDRFVDCFIHITGEDGKEKVLFEGW